MSTLYIQDRICWFKNAQEHKKLVEKGGFPHWQEALLHAKEWETVAARQVIEAWSAYFVTRGRGEEPELARAVGSLMTRDRPVEFAELIVAQLDSGGILANLTF
jgi:hypothetical protein